MESFWSIYPASASAKWHSGDKIEKSVYQIWTQIRAGIEANIAIEI
jgi:hypothetical protein